MYMSVVSDKYVATFYTVLLGPVYPDPGGGRSSVDLKNEVRDA